MNDAPNQPHKNPNPPNPSSPSGAAPRHPSVGEIVLYREATMDVPAIVCHRDARGNVNLSICAYSGQWRGVTAVQQDPGHKDADGFPVHVTGTWRFR